MNNENREVMMGLLMILWVPVSIIGGIWYSYESDEGFLMSMCIVSFTWVVVVGIIGFFTWSVNE